MGKLKVNKKNGVPFCVVNVVGTEKDARVCHCKSLLIHCVNGSRFFVSASAQHEDDHVLTSTTLSCSFDSRIELFGETIACQRFDDTANVRLMLSENILDSLQT